MKLPKRITHVQRLVNVEEPIEQFKEETSGLGDKLGALLVQLPPSLAFDESIARRFFEQLTAVFDLPIVCEPRHPSWFGSNAEVLLAEHGIGRVAADPSPVPAAAHPGGCQHLVYYRWHGSPRTYYSEYTPTVLIELAWRIRASHPTAGSVWCIFDNTAEGAATKNALALWHLLVR